MSLDSSGQPSGAAPSSAPAGDIRQRLATAGVLIVSFLTINLLAATSCSFSWLFVALVWAAAVICAWEFASVSSTGKRSRKLVVFTAPLVVLLVPTLVVCTLPICEWVSASSRFTGAILLGLCGAWALALAYMAWGGIRSLEEGAAVASDLFIGQILIGLGSGSLLGLVMLGVAHRAVLFLLFVVSINDTAALFTGRRFGGPKFAPLLSPKKTVSGSIGGFAGGMITAALAAPLIALPLGSLRAVVLAAAIVLAAQLGDLAKSFTKRLYGVKDTGTILPGHGGLLDRIDGVLAGAIVLFAGLLFRLEGAL